MNPNHIVRSQSETDSETKVRPNFKRVQSECGEEVGLDGKTYVITDHYRRMVELKWSGWRDSNPYSTTNPLNLDNLLLYQF